MKTQNGLKRKMKQKTGTEIFESKILLSDSWQRAYASFHAVFKKPLGWLCVANETDERLIRIDRKNYCDWYCQSSRSERKCEGFLSGFAKDKMSESHASFHSFSCHANRPCAFFLVQTGREKRACFFLCNLKVPFQELAEIPAAFYEYLQVAMELTLKNAELANFYETVHPRALALSTMHAVHRVVSSITKLQDLLPRIGRLSMQVLKAKICRIWLVTEEGKHLELEFASDYPGGKAGLVRRKMGTGFEGKVALNGEIYFNRRILAVPFLEQEVLGLIVLSKKADGSSFTQTDLEILKILAEQTVVAIKNAKLYDETQQITVGAVKSINDLLELDYTGDNVHMPLYSKLVREIALDMGLRREDVANLDRAILLLDTGLVGLPESIRSKTAKLTTEEYDLIKQHPHRGVNVLKSVSSLKPIIPIILHHHERYDGLGYPQGLKGEGIPVGARIVAVVDSFTAMISKRPYRESKKIEEAIAEIEKQKGMQFDPLVVDSFLRIIAKEFPGKIASQDGKKE